MCYILMGDRLIGKDGTDIQVDSEMLKLLI
jgi:hypothetical protein